MMSSCVAFTYSNHFLLFEVFNLKLGDYFFSPATSLRTCIMCFIASIQYISLKLILKMEHVHIKYWRFLNMVHDTDLYLSLKNCMKTVILFKRWDLMRKTTANSDASVIQMGGSWWRMIHWTQFEPALSPGMPTTATTLLLQSISLIHTPFLFQFRIALLRHGKEEESIDR